MLKFGSRAMAVLLLMVVCVSHAAAPTASDAFKHGDHTATVYAQDLKLQTRQGVAHMADTIQRSAARVTEDAGDAHTGAMLFGALAIMGVMVRRRWRARR
jgi:UrcA family protein